MSALPQSLSITGTQQLLATVWNRSLPLIRQRLALLSAAAQQAEIGCLSPSARLEAADTAHKLAGSLGMFGYLRGTELARELESLLEAEGPVSHEVTNLTAELVACVPV